MSGILSPMRARRGDFYRNRRTGGLIQVARAGTKRIVVAPYGGGLVAVTPEVFAERYERVSDREALALTAPHLLQPLD